MSLANVQLMEETIRCDWFMEETVRHGQFLEAVEETVQHD